MSSHVHTMSFDKRISESALNSIKFLSIFQISCNFPQSCSMLPALFSPNPSAHSMGEEKKKRKKIIIINLCSRFSPSSAIPCSNPLFSLLPPLFLPSRPTLCEQNGRPWFGWTREGKCRGMSDWALIFFLYWGHTEEKKEIKLEKKKKNIGKLPRQRTWSAIIAMRWSSCSMHGLCPFMLFAWSLFFLHLVFPCFSLFFREIFFFKILSAKNKSPKLCKLNMRLCGFGIKCFSVCVSSFKCVDAALCVSVGETNF